MITKNRLVAVIEIGSTGIRLVVAEIAKGGDWHVVDKAGKPVALGRDVFTSGSISREALLACLSVLHGFRELLSGWGIGDDEIRVIATSALREARNRDTFIDRVYLQTGFRVNVVEGIEENRLMYLAVRWALKDDRPQFTRSNSIIIEVGGGSTEMMLLRRGKMVAAHSIRLGTILIDQQVQQAMGSKRYLQRFLQESVKNTRESLSAELDLAHVRTFIVAGSDARLAAVRLGVEINDDCWVIERSAFDAFVERIQNYSVEECVQKLRIPFAEAEGIIPGLLTYKLFLEGTAATEIVVPNVSIREGLLITLASGVDPELQEEFFSQVIASAVSLGRKYRYDEAHSLHVARLALTLFDELKPDHGLDRRARLLLEVAAILHDVGMFIRSSGHHKHSQYIVANSEIFGLHRDDLDIVSNVVRYHRKAPPNTTHIAYIALQRDDRMLVLKLASILRVADAMDRGHSQRISEITVERRTDSIVLHAAGHHDLTLEQLGLEEKSDMFLDMFGYKVILT
jgi:exopolyphosphatase / guanosine-5'-triphosphate,3'-diphosphate pyrophosphatase